jgi:[lysine-biosynthesis-protein LysW]---L-2-aminoadipate ligase
MGAARARWDRPLSQERTPMTHTQHIPTSTWADPSTRPPHLHPVAAGPVDEFILIANELTVTNELLLDALRRATPGARLVRPTDLRTVATPARGVARLDVTRTMTGLEDGFAELRRFERSADVMNPASALIACHDKLSTARLLGRADLPHPRTSPLLGRHDRADGLEPPFVVKPRFGGWGLEVELCEDRAALGRHIRRVTNASWFQHQGAIVQELVPPTGADLRLIVAGGEVVGAVERLAAAGEWRTNVSLGGTRRPVSPPEDVRALAIAAAAVVRADLVGVDLVRGPDGGYLILELNGAADFRDEYSLDGEDVFDRAACKLISRGAASVGRAAVAAGF